MTQELGWNLIVKRSDPSIPPSNLNDPFTKSTQFTLKLIKDLMFVRENPWSNLYFAMTWELFQISIVWRHETAESLTILADLEEGTSIMSDPDTDLHDLGALWATRVDQSSPLLQKYSRFENKFRSPGGGGPIGS